jgi:hypothetical protein
MGAAQAVVSAADLERLLWLREGITIDVVVWNPVHRTATLLVSGAGVDVEPPIDFVEPEMIPIERLMTRIPIELGEPGYGEGERTFEPKRAATEVDWHAGHDFPDPLLLHKLAQDAQTAAEGSAGRFEAATCPACGGGLVERVPISGIPVRGDGMHEPELSFRSGVGLRCVDCGHREPIR